MDKTSFTKTEVSERKGWSLTLINKILGEPDKRKNYMGRDICLYDISRVLKAESGQDFISSQEKLERRKLAAKKAVESKTAKLMKSVHEMSVSVTKLDLNDLKKRAIESYNDWNAGKEKYATIHDEKYFLDRIIVNFIRHELTEYDEELFTVAGKTGISLAVDEIRRRVYNAISVVYPMFEQECIRQLHERRGFQS